MLLQLKVESKLQVLAKMANCQRKLLPSSRRKKRRTTKRQEEPLQVNLNPRKVSLPNKPLLPSPLPLPVQLALMFSLALLPTFGTLFCKLISISEELSHLRPTLRPSNCSEARSPTPKSTPIYSRGPQWLPNSLKPSRASGQPVN